MGITLDYAFRCVAPRDPGSISADRHGEAVAMDIRESGAPLVVEPMPQGRTSQLIEHTLLY